MITIYKHTCNSNNKSYIGLTKHTVEKRLKQHSKNTANLPFPNAIRKYGLDDFETIVLYECDTYVEAFTIEKYYISFYDSYQNGYNATSGGEGVNPEVIMGNKNPAKQPGVGKKISKAISGKKNGMYDKTHTLAARKAISDSMLGEKHQYFGKQRDKETRDKISATLTGGTKSEAAKKMVGDNSRGRIWINMNNKNKMSKPEDLNSYLAVGWNIGRHFHNKKEK